MIVKYTFVNGDVSETEVDAELFDEICQMEKKQENRDRAETRRHISYDILNEKGFGLSLPGDICEEHEKGEEILRLRDSLETLSAKQRELTAMIYFEGMSITDVAKIWGISRPAVSQQLATVKKN